MTAFVSILRRHRALFPVAAAAVAFATPGTASAGVALSTSGWEWSDPSPQGYSLNDIQFAGNRGYAVGAGGTALRTDDGGATWSGLFTGTSTTANSLDVIGPDTVAVSTGGGGNCSIRLSTDGGATFINRRLGDSDTDCGETGFRGFDFVNATTGFVIRNDGKVLTTTNGGDTFAPRSGVDGGTSIRFLNETTGYAASSNGKIYRTTDGAQTWTPIYDAGNSLSEIRLTSPTSILAWGDKTLVRSVDSGATFTPGTAVGGAFRATWADENHLAFVNGGKLILSDDGGTTTREITLGNKDVIAAGFVSPTRLYAVGTGGVMYVSDDAGANFARVSSDRIGGALSRINEGPGGPVGIGTAGAIARLENGKWVLRPTLSAAPVVDADFSSAERGYVLQGSDRLLQTTDNGKSWKIVSTGAPSSVYLVVTPNDDTVLLFGGFGIRRATSGGTFEAVTGKLVGKIKPQGARSLGGRVVVWETKKGQPVISPDAGQTWKAIKLPKGIKRTSDLRPLPGKGLLLEAQGRTFRSSDDAGKKWTEITSIGGLTGGINARITVASASEWFTGVDEEWPFPVVLHTTDAGKTWTPQAVGAAGTSITSLVSFGAKTAFALSGSGTPAENAIFSTTSGGSRGAQTKLSLDQTKTKLKRSGGKVQITGVLTGGLGGEVVHVAIRKVGGAGWLSSNVIVGANGGSFTASIKAGKGKYVAVAQWAGDSGRAGAGTPAKAFTITK